MAQPLTMERFDEACTPTGLPALASGIVAREQVAEHLELGVTGLLTLVQAPVGAGKTTAAASWASGVTQARGLVWLGLDRTSARPNVFVARLVEALDQAGVPGLPKVAHAADLAPVPRRALLTSVAAALRGTGPWLLVLDDFPTGTRGPLGTDLEFLLRNTDRALRVVMLSSAEPAMALHRLQMAGEVATITTSDLDLDGGEIAGLLRAAGVEPSARVVGEVQRHTHGWAAGVRLAATALANQPVAAAMAYVARTIEEYVVGEVLEPMPPDSRELVLHGSIVGSVPPGLATALMGVDCELAGRRAAASSAFVLLDADGTVRLHPLLRAVANVRLLHMSPVVARDAYRAGVRWYSEQGDLDTAMELSRHAGDWSWVARSLVESFVVRQILDGTYPLDALGGEVLEAEPLLLAAVALVRGNLPLAEDSIRRSASSAGSLTSAEISRSLLELEIARRNGDVQRGRQSIDAVRGLIATLPLDLGAEAAECARRLDASAGVLHLLAGRVHQAAIVLQRVCDDSRSDDLVRLDALGHHALVEAIRGNLDQSARESHEVLLAASRSGHEAAAVPGHLAAAWVHTDRAEVDQARQRLQIVAGHRRDHDQLAVVLRRILEARLLIAEGQSESAVRLIGGLQQCDEMPAPGWLADMVAVQLARGWIAVGEPRRALAAVTPEPEMAAAEGRVVAAHARLNIGDLRGARALLSAVRSDLGQAALGVQVEAWVHEARIAAEAEQLDRARLLVDRALRAAGTEGVRTAFSGSVLWLRGFVGRDQRLLRAHREFLTSLVGGHGVAAGMPSASSADAKRRLDDQVVEPLTERECQVLELLAMMCSTDEIATELFVSGNTVKTHVKGIFRKLGVNRRVDAVRAGRSLGLC